MTEPEIECIGFKRASLIYKEGKEHIYQGFLDIYSVPIKVTDEFAKEPKGRQGPSTNFGRRQIARYLYIPRVHSYIVYSR